HEDNRMSGRLLERLEERVLSRDVQRFGIVDDRDANRGAGGLEPEPSDKLANLIDQDVGAVCRAFDPFEIRMHSGGDLDAGRAAFASRALLRACAPAPGGRGGSGLAHGASRNTATKLTAARSLAQ